MILDRVIKIRQLFIVIENLLIVGFEQLRILSGDPIHRISCLNRIKVLCRQSQTGHLMYQVSHFKRFKGELEIFETIVKKLILEEVYLINLLRC